jgi:hypothetical protein
VGVCTVIWAIWNNRNDHVFNKPKKILRFAGYSYGYPLDSYVVLSPTREAVRGDGFWVQPIGNGSTRFITPVRVAVAQ